MNEDAPATAGAASVEIFFIDHLVESVAAVLQPVPEARIDTDVLDQTLMRAIRFVFTEEAFRLLSMSQIR